jgi:hypothetical protein
VRIARSKDTEVQIYVHFLFLSLFVFFVRAGDLESIRKTLSSRVICTRQEYIVIARFEYESEP